MSLDKSDLTKEEKAAVTRMTNAMKILSKRHWFYGTSGDLCIMRYGEDGDREFAGGGTTYNQDFIVCSVGPGEGLDIDGGDW